MNLLFKIDGEVFIHRFFSYLILMTPVDALPKVMKDGYQNIVMKV